MLKNLQIQINKPCGEHWDGMKPRGEGRFCSSCSKTVMDFTTMSDREIVEWFAHPESHVNTCGRLHQSQLSRELITGQSKKNRASLFWNYLMTALLMGTEVRTQNVNAAANTSLPAFEYNTAARAIVVGELTSVNVKKLHVTIDNIADTLSGRLVSTDGKPVPFATMTVSGGHKFISDADGYFNIPKNAARRPYTILLSGAGFKSMEINIVKTWRNGGSPIINIPVICETMGLTVVVTRETRTPKVMSFLKDSLSFLGISKKAMNVYPNPVARGGSVAITGDFKESGFYTVQLLNLSGSLVTTVQIESMKNMQRVTMQISGTISAGVYILRLSNPGMKKDFAQQIEVF